ncbi:MAG: hypothetical protein Q9167_007276 [Letrouitia subvulpina]
MNALRLKINGGAKIDQRWSKPVEGMLSASGFPAGCGIRPDIQCTDADDAWYCPADTPVCGLSYGLCLGSGPACEPEETSSTTYSPSSGSSTAEPSSRDNDEEPHETSIPEAGSGGNGPTPSRGNSNEEASPAAAETSAISDEIFSGSRGQGGTTTAAGVQTTAFPTRSAMVTSAVNPGSGGGGGGAIGESPNPTSTQNELPSMVTGSPPSTPQIGSGTGTEKPQQPSGGIGTSASQTPNAPSATQGAATSSMATQPSSRAVVSKKNALWEGASSLIAVGTIALYWNIW